MTIEDFPIHSLRNEASRVRKEASETKRPREEGEEEEKGGLKWLGKDGRCVYDVDGKRGKGRGEGGAKVTCRGMERRGEGGIEGEGDGEEGGTAGGRP